MLHISDKEEIRLKKEYLEKLFKTKVKLTSLDRFNYRNKVTLHVQNNKLGFYNNGTNNLVPINKCLLLRDDINKVIELLNTFDLNEISEIVIKYSNKGLLIKTNGKLRNNDLITLIKNKSIKSIYQNDLLIYGDKYIETDIDDKKYLLNHNSFFQVNTLCMEKLYNKIKENAETGNKLLDLYCGVASIGIYLSDSFKSITGIEIDKDSYKCALENIKLNKIKNYNMILGDANEVNNKYDVVIVDPPRGGLSKKVISNLKKMKTSKIIYISCNPSTLKRDIDLLDNYEVKNIEAFNMFPGTRHVEVSCVLSLKQ